MAHSFQKLLFRVNLTEGTKGSNLVFFLDPAKPCETIGPDGLPIPGRLYKEDDPYYSAMDTETGNCAVHKFKYAEPAYCGLVRIVEESDLKGKCVSFAAIFIFRL